MAPDAAAAVEQPAPDLAAQVVAFCAASPQLGPALGGGIAATPLSGGYINDVFMVEGSAGRLLVKRGGPTARGDADIRVDQARVATEAAVMALAHAAAPAHSPALVLFDGATHTLAAEFLEGRETLTVAVCRGAVHPQLAAHAGTALAAVGAAGAAGALGGAAHAQLAATLAASDSCAGIVEQFALYEPFDPDDASGRRVPPGLEGEVEALIVGHNGFQAELAALRRLLRRPPGGAATVVHQDIWGSNILVAASGPPSTHIIDWELALRGHPIFDMGHLFATLCMCALAARGLGEAGDQPDARPTQEAWLTAGLEQAWEAYWAVRRERGPPAGLPSGADDERASLADCLGFAGCVLLRWSVGAFNIAEVMGLPPGTSAHTAAVRRAVHLGSALVRLRRRIPSARAAAAMLRAALEDGSVEAAAALVPEAEAAPLPAEALPPTKAQMLRGRTMSCKLSTRDLGRLSQRFMRSHTSRTLR